MAPTPYSRAFETFVAEPTDIVGLLAYASYKANIRQNHVSGVAVPAAVDRHPGVIERNAYRGAAEQALESYLDVAIEPYKTEWTEQGRLVSIDEAADRVVAAQRAGEDRLMRAVAHGTNFWTGVLAGIVSWLVSIAVTILVVYAAQDWVFQILHVTVVREHGGG